MFKKKDIKAFYEELLGDICTIMGDDKTSDLQLNQIGKSLFGRKWNGVFASNESYPSTGYSIVNLDTAGEPGSHWVAVANGNVYDSFGRCGLLNDERLTCAGDKRPDQLVREDNCGQRCLAWLLVFQVCGIEGANKI
jgi:hypothetical protein